jgi:hypothetical protein
MALLFEQIDEKRKICFILFYFVCIFFKQKFKNFLIRFIELFSVKIYKHYCLNKKKRRKRERKRQLFELNNLRTKSEHVHRQNFCNSTGQSSRLITFSNRTRLEIDLKLNKVE